MKINSMWKNVLLLTIGSVFALHVQMVSAQDNVSEVKTTTETTSVEDCVITEDQE
jgi:hypothetical protein